MSPEETLRELEQAGLRRSLSLISDVRGARLVIEGREVVNFCSNDYLGLSQHPELLKTLRAGDGPAFGAGASRLLCGTHAVHADLEKEMADFKGLPRALLFGSAYLANVGLLTSIADAETTVISDRLNHASLIDGIRLSRGRVRIVEHARPEAVEEALRETTGRRLIVTETLFSMDGDRAPLAEYRRLAARYGADLLVDDTHGFGVYGDQGRGLAGPEVTIQVCNLSKAGGALGGFALGDETLIDLLISRARTFIYTTALPVDVCRTGLKAIELIRSAEDRRRHLSDLCRRFRQAVDVRVEGPIFPIHVGPSDRAMAAAAALYERGFFMPAIRPPTVPEGSSRLRVSLTALHTVEDIDALVEALTEVL